MRMGDMRNRSVGPWKFGRMDVVNPQQQQEIPRLRQPTPPFGSTVPRPDGTVTDMRALAGTEYWLNQVAYRLRLSA